MVIGECRFCRSEHFRLSQDYIVEATPEAARSKREKLKRQIYKVKQSAGLAATVRQAETQEIAQSMAATSTDAAKIRREDGLKALVERREQLADNFRRGIQPCCRNPLPYIGQDINNETAQLYCRSCAMVFVFMDRLGCFTMQQEFKTKAKPASKPSAVDLDRFANLEDDD
jgi:hypothetical protein